MKDVILVDVGRVSLLGHSFVHEAVAEERIHHQKFLHGHARQGTSQSDAFACHACRSQRRENSQRLVEKILE